MSGILLGILANEPYVGRKAKLRAARGSWEHPVHHATEAYKVMDRRVNLFDLPTYTMMLELLLENLQSPEPEWPQEFCVTDINSAERDVVIENAEEAEQFLEGDHPDTYTEGLCA